MGNQMAFDSAPFNEDSYLEYHFLELRDRFNIETIVETGTFHGVTTLWFSNNFKHVFTTEIVEEFHNVANQKFTNFSDKITSLLGDSINTLPDIINRISGNTIFFLDAHWYTNPLLNELRIIKDSGYKPTIICIHDMQNPNDLTMGYDVYPDQNIIYNYEWVKPYIEEIYGINGYRHYYNKYAVGARRGALFIINKVVDGNNLF